MYLIVIAPKDRILVLSYSIITIIYHFNQCIHHTLSHHCIATSFFSAAACPPAYCVPKYGIESRNLTWQSRSVYTRIFFYENNSPDWSKQQTAKISFRENLDHC